MAITYKTYELRLLKLATLLENLPPERFDWAQWVGEDWKGKQDLSCGTKACALGWACTIPSLRKAGLRLTRRDNWDRFFGYVKNINTNSDSVEAAAEVFNLPKNVAFRIFEPGAYSSNRYSPRHVAGLIRKAVARGDHKKI